MSEKVTQPATTGGEAGKSEGTATEGQPASGQTDGGNASLSTPPPAKQDDPAPQSQDPPKKEEAKEPPKVPEKYDLKPPKDSVLDARAVEEIAAFAKAQGFSQEQAQAHLERENKAISSYVSKQQQMSQELNHGEWLQTLKTDREVGGANFDANGQLAYRAAVKWFGEEFVDVLRKSNLNHYPALFKGLVKLGQAQADDTMVQPGAQSGGAKKSPAEIIYGTSQN